MHYNFARHTGHSQIHTTHPGDGGGVADRVYSLTDIAGLLD